MTDKERLAALQFPVYLQMREAGQFWHEMKLESNAIKHLSGNAWHAGNASLVLLTALSCAELSSPLLRLTPTRVVTNLEVSNHGAQSLWFLILYMTLPSRGDTM